MPILTPRLIRKFIFISCLICCSLLLSQPSAFAQSDEEDKADRETALQLYDQHHMTEALPILEKLYAINPKDMVVVERLAFATFASAAAIKDAEGRKQTRKRAREFALKAKELGDESNLLKTILEAPPDGGEGGFSNRKDIDAAMREGEAAFVKGDFKKALAAYETALQMDPQLYTAALFSGDVYYKQGDVKKAGEWFAKAIEINPDVETAYRYWGDALMNGSNKKEEARDKFIEAIIADPYSRRSWMGLTQWGDKYGVKLAHPKIDVPTSSVQRKDDKNISILFDPGNKKDDGADAWMFYSIARAAWMTDETRKKEFPNEKQYRHSLKEEGESLKMVVEMVEKNIRDKKAKENALNPSINNLLKLHRAGLLESYVLFTMADQGIAQDYVLYRKSDREKLRQYLREVVVNSGQIKNK